jgi:hypothetical protein
MSLAEFKAWLDGFKEAVGDAPTPEQWQKVLTKLQDVQPLANFGQFAAPNGGWQTPTALRAVPTRDSASTQAVVNGVSVGPSD